MEPQTFDLMAIGTPVIDRFADVDDAFLEKFGLSKGSSNFIALERLGEVERALKEKITALYPGDNARNVCEGFARLERENEKEEKRAPDGAKKMRIGYAGKISHDGMGGLFSQNLQKIGVEKFLEFDGREKTGLISCLITPDKERTFAVYLGASSNEINAGKLPGAKMVFCTSITLLTPGAISKSAHEYVMRSKKAGSKIALSLESPAMLEANRERARRICKLADILFLNEDEAKALGEAQKEKGADEPPASARKKENGANDRSLGGPESDFSSVSSLAPLVFLKKGRDGSMVFKNGKPDVSMPAQAVQKVVDTTGAGDAYAAGALYALACGQGAKEAALEGSKLAARVIQKIGNRLD